MDKLNQSSSNNYTHSSTKYKKRNETREEKIKIISSLPHDTSSYSNKPKVNYEELNLLLKRTKEEGYSYTNELMNIQEFNNPENIKVRQ